MSARQPASLTATMFQRSFVFAIALRFAYAFKEQPSFCIHAEPLLLSEMDRYEIALKENNTNCHITVRMMTAKEKNSFIDTMCVDHGSTNRDDYQYFKLLNGELIGRGSYREVCANRTSQLYAWLPYDVVQKYYAQALNPEEHVSYVAKATNIEHEKTELCHFRHTDLVNNLSREYFTCTVMIFEDNFYRADENINVLVEIEPLMYQIRNITYSPLRNVTSSYKTLLGKSVLKNAGHEKKPIYNSISYNFVEKVKVNTSLIFADKAMRKLPLLFEHKYAVLRLDKSGNGGMEMKEKAYFGRHMDPKSEVKVNVVGQWVQQRRIYSADIYNYFGHDIKLYNQPLKYGEVEIRRINSTEPVFETIESTNLALGTIFQPNWESERLLMNATNDSEKDEWSVWEDEDSTETTLINENRHPYPGFYPWFVVCCILFGIVIVFVIYSVVHMYSKKKNTEKTKYELTGM